MYVSCGTHQHVCMENAAACQMSSTATTPSSCLACSQQLTYVCCLQAVLALGVALCVLIVILAKKALKKLQQQELEREAEIEAQEAAAQAGTAPVHDMGVMRCTNTDVDCTSKQPLPLAIESKVPGAAKQPAAGSDGDLQVILVDDGSTSTADLSRGSPNNSFIPAGQVPPAALETQPSASDVSRVSSLSSLRGLLSQTFRRSS